MDWKAKYGITSVENNTNEPSTPEANLKVPKTDWKTKYGITSQPTTEATPKVTLEKQKPLETTPTEKFTIAGAEPKYILSELGKQLKETSLMDWTKGLGTAIYGAGQTFIPTKIINALDHHFHITERLNKLPPLVKTGIELTAPPIFGIMEGQREMEKAGAKEALEAHPVAKELSGLAGDLGNMILANAILPNPAESIKRGILKNAPEPVKQFLIENKRYGATILRYLSQAPRSVGMFGGLNFLKEATDQIDKGEFSPTKLISQTLKGGGWGLAATFPTILPTYPLRITGGVVTGAVWSSFETLVKNKQITKEDIPSIASNAILMGAFQALTTKNLTRVYEQIYLDDVGHYINVNKYGEETANLLGRLNYLAIVNEGTPQGDLYASARDKLVAKIGLRQNIDYIIKNNQIQIINPNTGRIEAGKEYFPGIKNALEIKEGIQIHPKEQLTGIKPIGVERSLSEILTPSEKFLIEHIAETSGKVPIMDLKLLEPNPQVQKFQIKYPDIITRIDLQLGHTVPSNTTIDTIQNFPSSLVTPIEIKPKAESETKSETKPEAKPEVPKAPVKSPTFIKEEVKPETKPIPKELEPLAEEARKYKSAEEFVKKFKMEDYQGDITPDLWLLHKMTFHPTDLTNTIDKITSTGRMQNWYLDQLEKSGFKNPKITTTIKEIKDFLKAKTGFEDFTDFYNLATKGIKEVKPKTMSLEEYLNKKGIPEFDYSMQTTKYGRTAKEQKRIEKQLQNTLSSQIEAIEEYYDKVKKGEIIPPKTGEPLMPENIIARVRNELRLKLLQQGEKPENVEKIITQKTAGIEQKVHQLEVEGKTPMEIEQIVRKDILGSESGVKPTEEIKTTPNKVTKAISEELKAPSGMASIGKFADNTEIKIGHLNSIRPIEFPELVELATELTKGNVPEIKRSLGKALGKFVTIDSGRIKLTADLFRKGNEEQLAKALAHEIGHLIDYLPERTLKRGNLLGSLLTLRHFLKNQYGEVVVTNKEIREELKAVSKYWRPWDENLVPKSFANYRNSARELYADAISVLFNSPGTLEEMAPKFYTTFFEYLDQKPDVKKAYFDLQEILSHDRETLIQLRRQRVQEMFDEADYKAEELQKIREKERKLRFRDFWNYFTYSIKSINQPIYNKVRELRRKGVYISDDENPEYLLSGRNYLSGRIKAEIDTNVQPIMKDLFNHNIDWKTFGEFLYYERIIEGDRSEFANPRGITPQVAEELRNNIKETLGDRYPILEKNADKFRQFLKDLAKEAYDAGLYSNDMFDIINGNSKYVPFQVVEYMDNYVNWRTKSQVGTLKDINNPANSLILKAISTIKAIENQKVRQATIKMLEEHFPDEIKDADTRFNGRIKVPIESRDSKFKLVTYYENGKLKGKYVDPYIAASLDKDSIAQNKAVMTVLSPIKKLNQKVFRPLFVVYNPGWIPFNFIRDFMRLWKNTPGLTWGKMAKLYVKAFRPAKVRAFGANKNNILDKQAEALITKLEKEGVFSITWNDIMLGQETEDAQIQAILKRIGLAETEKEIPAINKNIDKVLRYTGIKKIADWIEKTGELVETLPKVAAYYELENKMSPNEMRTFIRRNAGSPDFLEKGYLTAMTNDIFLFSNAIIQAISADANVAVDPRTRSGFWWKTAKSIFLPKLLMFLALAGVFGLKIKKMMQDVSEYDLTNYIIIPIGRDTKNTKTVYLRIPTDEAGRFLGAIFWKLLNSYSNDETVMQDIGDIASLFGGQLPSLTPSIEIPLTTAQFLSGKNPYDSFRNRQVLTEQQFKAGGWYALKPFLLWQFEQAGGNIFMKFYAGEQTPTTKTPGERFLRSPIISNVLGRFIKVSDYGEIERYRRKTNLIEQKKARESIDETKIINKYVQEYQKTKKNPIVLSREMIKEILGHNPRGQEEIQKARRLKKKFQISIEKGKADPKINALISANTNDEKEALLRVFKEDMSESEFLQFKKEILKYKIVSPEVLRKLNRPIKK